MIGVRGACQPVGVKAEDRSYYKHAEILGLTLPGLKDSSNTTAVKQSQAWEFPSSDVKYCSVDDTVCKQCVQSNFWLPDGVDRDSRYCVGADGCVCISNCGTTILDTVCQKATTSSPSSDGSSDFVLPPVPTTTPSLTAPSPTTPPPTSTKSNYIEPDSTEMWDLFERKANIAILVVGVLIVFCCCFGVALRRRRRARRAVLISRRTIEPEAIPMAILLTPQDSLVAFSQIEQRNPY